MKIIKEKDDSDPNDIVLIESLTYYKLEFLTNDWILKTLYISKPQISLQESMTIIQLNLPQEMKEEILIKVKIEILRTKIYLMVMTLDLNLVNNNIDNNIQEAYNQNEDLREILFRKSKYRRQLKMSEMTIKTFIQKAIDKYLEKRQSLCKDFTNSKRERSKIC